MPPQLPTHHLQTIRRADQAADEAEAAVHRWWADLLAILRAGPNLGVTRLHQMALAHFRRLKDVTARGLRDALEPTLRYGYQSAVAGLRRRLPTAYLRRAAIRRGFRSRGLRESVQPVLEEPLRSRGGLATFSMTPRGLNITTARLTQDALDELEDDDDLDADEIRQAFLDLLFPPPPEEWVRQHTNRLIAPFLAAPRPDLKPPELLANVLISHYSQGATQQEIAKALLPEVDGVRASARRVARTWGIALANDGNMAAHEQLGDMVIGYELFSARRVSSRPWHVERHGTVYKRNPGPGEKGFFQMPHPPREPDDINERPLGTPALAWS